MVSFIFNIFIFLYITEIIPDEPIEIHIRIKGDLFVYFCRLISIIKNGLHMTTAVDIISIQNFLRGGYMAEITFEIVKHIGKLSESAKGWTKEVNMISWNGRDPKIDIREWAPDHEKAGKGITLSQEEWEKLKSIINNE